MKYLIPGWVHNPGVHCASTVISDAMNFHGIGLDEAMCFGIGCGLGFFYLEGEFMNPSRMTAVRSRMLEARFFENLGRPFQWVIDLDPDRALNAAKEHLHRQRPVLLRADIAHLPHYQTDTHFPGHVIAMWGYDDDQALALVADTGWEGLQEVSYQNLGKARYGGLAYMKNQGDHYPVDAGGPIPDLASVVRKALWQQAKDLIGLEINMPGIFGFKAMATATESMPRWAEAKDWKWCARWLYQVIERRGTGGGAFRLLYSRFLEQLETLDPGLAKIAPAIEMKRIARDWTDLSLLLKQISEQEAPGGFERAASILDRIRGRETAFFANIQSNISG